MSGGNLDPVVGVFDADVEVIDDAPVPVLAEGFLVGDVQRQAGLGLGLFIVRMLVGRNGGRVEASSEGSGEGSRFRVVLRAAPQGSVDIAHARKAAHATAEAH